MKIETKKELWVFSSFTGKFGNKEIKPAKTVSLFKRLKKNMFDSEIKRQLGAQECTLADVAAFLKNPPKGCDDGYANLFYVAGYVVRVNWVGDDRGWGVRAWELDDGLWPAGSRVFSRNWHSDPQPLAPSPSDTLPLELIINGINRTRRRLRRTVR